MTFEVRAGARRAPRSVNLTVTAVGVTLLMAACDGKSDIQRDQPIPPTPQSVNRIDPSVRAEATVPAATAGAPQTRTSAPAVPSTEEARDRPQACSALGLVSAKWRSEDQFELQRRDISPIMNALGEYARTNNEDQLAPAKSASGKDGLRVLGVGPKAECGLQSNDVLLKVNDIPVTARARLVERREQLMAADEVKLTIERDQKTRVITYTIRD